MGEAQIRLSLSHSRGWVAAVASTEPCGIDIEAPAVSIPWRALDALETDWVRAQPSPESAFTQLWVRKEATFKTGLLRAADPTQVSVWPLVRGATGTIVPTIAWRSDGNHDEVFGCVAALTDDVRVVTADQLRLSVSPRGSECSSGGAR